MLKRAKLDIHYSPGEHDITDAKTRDAYLERFGKGAGGGWYAFDHGGVHFVSLVNVVDLKTNGLGSLGPEQLAWLDDDLRGKSASTPSSSSATSRSGWSPPTGAGGPRIRRRRWRCFRASAR